MMATAIKTHDYSKPAWGHKVEILNIKDEGIHLRVAGFGSNVSVEDFLILPNEGATTRYVVGSIQYQVNPKDMWFADLIFAPGGEGCLT